LPISKYWQQKDGNNEADTLMANAPVISLNKEWNGDIHQRACPKRDINTLFIYGAKDAGE